MERFGNSALRFLAFSLQPLALVSAAGLENVVEIIGKFGGPNQLRNADSFRQDLHPDLKADFILANPPFNMSDWGGENLRQDVRWKFGMPPVNNANYSWIQHFIHHLSPVGVAGFVMTNQIL
jgi:type I restriction-modification system DNA methylase subunit